MIRLIQWLFLGHIHKWEKVSESELNIIDPYAVTENRRVVAKGKRFVTRCEKCGSYKKWDLT